MLSDFTLNTHYVFIILHTWTPLNTKHTLFSPGVAQLWEAASFTFQTSNTILGTKINVGLVQNVDAIWNDELAVTNQIHSVIYQTALHPRCETEFKSTAARSTALHSTAVPTSTMSHITINLIWSSATVDWTIECGPLRACVRKFRARQSRSSSRQR